MFICVHLYDIFLTAMTVIIYIFYSPEMVAAKEIQKKKIKKNTQISKAKARKTNMHCRLFS